MKSFLRENGLALFFAALFASTLVAQSFAGQHQQNAELAQHGSGSVSWWEYVTSPEFWGAVMENWQSEFLQFAVFIAATIWFVQKGSNESKKLDDVGLETDEQQKLGAHTLRRSPLWAKAGGFRTALYSNSLLLVMSAIFLTSWFAQSLGDWRTFNAGQREHSDEPDLLGPLPPRPRLLGEDAAELAVGVPRDRGDGGVHDLPPPAWLTRVEASRGAARRDSFVGLEGDGSAPG